MPDLLDTYAEETAFSDEQVSAFVQQLDRDRRLQADRSPSLERLRALLLWPGAGLAVCALAFFFLRPPPDPGAPPEPGVRGVDAVPVSPEQAPVQVTLRLAIEQGAVTQLLKPDQPAVQGDRVFFRVSTTGAAPVTVWAAGPAGQQALSTFSADGPGDFDVPLGDALLAWRFDAPGQYRFWATTSADGGCPPATCDFREVTVD